jgi:hypothetical protein
MVSPFHFDVHRDVIEESPVKEWMVNCLCGAHGKNYDDGVRMVECTKCLCWMHTECNGIKDSVDPPNDFVCKPCKAKHKRLAEEKVTLERQVHHRYIAIISSLISFNNVKLTCFPPYVG